MVEIPIALFMGFIAFAFTLMIIGLVRKTPAFMVFSGLFILTIVVMTDSIILDSFQDGGTQEEIYNVDSSTGSMNVNGATRTHIAEFPSTSSSPIWHSTFNCINIHLSKTGSPSTLTDVIIGVFGSTGTTDKEFGRVNPSVITTAFRQFEFCLPLGEEYTLTDNQRIGAFYNFASATDFVNVQIDANNPFDGTVTFLQRFESGAWASTTTQDVKMILSLESTEETVRDNFEFTEFPKVIFSLFAVTLMLIGALMVRYDF